MEKKVFDVKKLREELGLTQLELANQLGVSVVAIQNYENGRSNPSKLVREKLARLDTRGATITTQTITGDNNTQNEIVASNMAELIKLLHKQQDTISSLVMLMNGLSK